MATAPEKISIKRRRTEEPVGHLIYQSKKQRTAEHVFIRLSTSRQTTRQSESPITDPGSQSLVPKQSLGIPTVKITQPGDEAKDFERYKAVHRLSTEAKNRKQDGNTTAATSVRKERVVPRRFHLTRDLSTFFRPQSTGIRKSKSNVRPHLPTFVEKRQAQVESNIALLKQPVDRIVEFAKDPSDDAQVASIFSDDANVTKHTIATFHKNQNNGVKTGNSIYDDPTTWNIESDKLADELAALALEMDPSVNQNHEPESHNTPHMPAERTLFTGEPEEFVYETYIRMSRDVPSYLELSSRDEPFGYLIIDEEEESLWEQYLRDENGDDDSWDEEDEDSNAEDNPRNEYPDEEMSSDDELGTNLYRYRRHGSDDEQFDEDYE